VAKPKLKCLVKKPKRTKAGRRCCSAKSKKAKVRGRSRGASVRQTSVPAPIIHIPPYPDTIVQVPQDPPPVINLPAPVVQVGAPNVTVPEPIINVAAPQVTVPEPVVQVITQTGASASGPLQTALSAYLSDEGGVTLFTQGSSAQSILNRSGVLRELRPDGLVVLEPAEALPGELLYYAAQQIIGFHYPRYQA
jgi:hypothetical protein